MDLGIILGIVGAVIGIAGIIIGLWVARTSAVDVKGTITLLGLAGLDQDFEVRWRGQAVEVPSLINVQVTNLGPKDVSVRDFEGGTVESSYTQARALGILSDGTSDPDAWQLSSDADNKTFTIRLLPRIMKPQDPAEVTVLCDGAPRRSQTLVRISGVREMSRRRRWIRRYGVGVLLAIALGIGTGAAFYWTTGPRDPNAPRVEFSPSQRLWMSILFGAIYGGIVLFYTWGRHALRARRRRRLEQEGAKARTEAVLGEVREAGGTHGTKPANTGVATGEHGDSGERESAIVNPRRIAPAAMIEAAAAYQEALRAAGIQATVRVTSQGLRIYLQSSSVRATAIQALAPEYHRYGIPYRLSLAVTHAGGPTSEPARAHNTQDRTLPG